MGDGLSPPSPSSAKEELRWKPPGRKLAVLAESLPEGGMPISGLEDFDEAMQNFMASKGITAGNVWEPTRGT